VGLQQKVSGGIVLWGRSLKSNVWVRSSQSEVPILKPEANPSLEICYSTICGL